MGRKKMNVSCIPTAKVCSTAADVGHLDCLEVAHRLGFSWNKDVCMNAAKNGDLDCLKFAHENGCPWGKDLQIGRE